MQDESGAERHEKATIGCMFKTSLFKAQHGILTLCVAIVLPNQRVLLRNESEKCPWLRKTMVRIWAKPQALSAPSQPGFKQC